MGKEYCVYMHIFPNGKRYVGITCCDPNRRWQNGYGYRTQKYVWRAISKYGWDNIQHIVLKENLTSCEAGKLEKLYIQRYRTNDKKHGYNIKEGGQVGYHLSDEHKKAIGRANSGENNGMYGHRYTEEDKRRIGGYWLGKHHTDESKKKMSEYRKAHPLSMELNNHPMARAVVQLDLSGNYIRQYGTASEAAMVVGAQRSGICMCAKGKTKTAGGYVWRYADGIEPKI